MRKTIIIIISLIFSLSANAQEETQKIILKFGKHQNFYRFVFISEEIDIIHSSSVVLQKDDKISVSFFKDIQVEFEGRILKEEDTIKGIKVYKKNSSLIFSTSNIKEIKVFKYESPYKIVIDAYLDEKTVEEKKLQKGSFLIDAGHGGTDEGLKVNEYKEKDISLTICKELASKLAQKSINTSLTRATDEELPIKKRVQITNNIKPLFFLSIHVSSDDYFTIYSSPIREQKQEKDSKIFILEEKFIKTFLKSVKQSFSEQVYHEKIPLTILKNSNSPAIMIEIPKKALSSNKAYVNKIIDVLTQTIIVSLSNLSNKDKIIEEKK